MEDIYKFFDIPKNATERQIKDSFRKRSKKTHPDAGGNREEFEKSCKYYRILIDKSSRFEYDNGTYREEKNDKFEFIIGVLFKIIEANDPSVVNIISKATDFVKNQINKARNQIFTLKDTEKKYEKFLDNLREKSDNMITAFVESHIKSIEIDIKNTEKEIEFFNDSLNFIEENLEYSIRDFSVDFTKCHWVNPPEYLTLFEKQEKKNEI